MVMTEKEMEKEFKKITSVSHWEWVEMPVFFLTVIVWILFTAKIGWFYELCRLDTMTDSVGYIISTVLLFFIICSLIYKGFSSITYNTRISEWKKLVHKDLIGQLETKRLEAIEISISKNSLETIEASDIKIPVKIKEFRDGILYDRTLYVKVVKEKLLNSSYLSYQEFEGFKNPNMSDYISAGIYNLTLFIPEEEVCS